MTFATKGTYQGPCNRTVCQKPGATFYNKSTEAWYCEECAREINRCNMVDSMLLYGTPDLCEEMTPKDVDAWQDSRDPYSERDQAAARVIHLEMPEAFDYPSETLRPAKGPTPNRYTPHQGSREMARRKKRMR